jgi:hypothetical protein
MSIFFRLSVSKSLTLLKYGEIITNTELQHKKHRNKTFVTKSYTRNNNDNSLTFFPEGGESKVL